MANIYWYKTGTDAVWETVTGNWWNDANHTEQASAIPQANDSVYLLGSTAPSANPAVDITLTVFDTSGCSAIITGQTWENITIATGGTLTIGSSILVHNWVGDASAASVCNIGAGLAQLILGNTGGILNLSGAVIYAGDFSGTVINANGSCSIANAGETDFIGPAAGSASLYWNSTGGIGVYYLGTEYPANIRNITIYVSNNLKIVSDATKFGMNQTDNNCSIHMLNKSGSIQVYNGATTKSMYIYNKSPNKISIPPSGL